MLDNPGVYAVICTPTGETYIGGTTNTFRQRFREHRSQLRCGRCSIPRLQQACDTHGLDALQFVPLEVFPPEEVAKREREAIKALKPALNVKHTPHRMTYSKTPEIELEGVVMTMAEAGRKYDVLYRTIRTRYDRGLRGPDLITPPHAGPRKKNRGWGTRRNR